MFKESTIDHILRMNHRRSTQLGIELHLRNPGLLTRRIDELQETGFVGSKLIVGLVASDGSGIRAAPIHGCPALVRTKIVKIVDPVAINVAVDQLIESGAAKFRRRAAIKRAPIVVIIDAVAIGVEGRGCSRGVVASRLLIVVGASVNIRATRYRWAGIENVLQAIAIGINGLCIGWAAEAIIAKLKGTRVNIIRQAIAIGVNALRIRRTTEAVVAKFERAIIDIIRQAIAVGINGLRAISIAISIAVTIAVAVAIVTTVTIVIITLGMGRCCIDNHGCKTKGQQQNGYKV